MFKSSISSPSIFCVFKRLLYEADTKTANDVLKEFRSKKVFVEMNTQIDNNNNNKEVGATDTTKRYVKNRLKDEFGPKTSLESRLKQTRANLKLHFGIGIQLGR